MSFRAVLLFSLAPILLFCGWVAKQDMFYPVDFVTVSPDGRHLLTVHTSTHSWHRDPVVRLWDLRTGHFLRELREDTQTAAFSTDGHLIAISQMGEPTISFRDSQTLEELYKVTTQELHKVLTPGSVHPLQFSQDDKYLLLMVEQSPNPLHLVHVDTGIVADNWCSQFFSSTARGRDLFLDHIPEVRVVQFTDGKFALRYSHTFASPFRSYVVTSDGSLVAVLFEDNHVAIWRPGNSEVVETNLGVSPKSFIRLLDRGRSLAVCESTGAVTIWDWQKQQRVGGWRLADSRYLLPVESPHQEETALVYSLQAPLTLYDLSNGKVIATLPMRLTNYFVLLGAGAVAFVTWIILWIRSGIRSERSWPALDLGVVHSAVLLLLIVRFLYTESRQDLERPIVVIAWSDFLALLSLVGLWLIQGRDRWPVRIAGVIVTVASICALIVMLWRGEGYVIWQAGIGMISFGCCLAFAFRILKWPMRSAGPIVEYSGSQNSLRRSQITMRDLMLLATAAATFFAAARLVKPNQVSTWVFLFIIFNGATYAIASTTAVWTALSHRSRYLRAILFVVLTGVAGCLPTEAFRKAPIFIQPLWWYLTAHVLLAILVWITLVVFRTYRGVGTPGTTFS